MSQYFSSYSGSENNIKAELDLSSHAKKLL